MNRRKALSTPHSFNFGPGWGRPWRKCRFGKFAEGEKVSHCRSADPSRSHRGAGRGCKKLICPTLVSSAQCDLVAICDVDSRVLGEAHERAKAQYAEQGQAPSIETYGDFRKLLENPAIDAVVIAVPDHWHVPITKAAIRAGIDVYVEKPLSLYVTEGRDLVDFVESRDAIVQVGTQHRSMDRIFLAQSAVQNGLLGKIKHTEVRIPTRHGTDLPFAPQPVPPELNYDMWVGPVMWTDYHPDRIHYNFRFVSDFSGGEIANWGAHFLDSAQQILGLDQRSPVRVAGKGKRHPAGGIHSSFFDIDVDYEYADGTTLHLSSSIEEEDMGVEVQGEKGTLFVNRDVLKIDDPELLKAIPKAEAQSYRKSKGSHMRNWLECVRSRKKENLHAPLETAHRSAILCHLANIAIEVGRPLQWDSENEIFVNDAFANALLNRPVRKKWSLE